MAVINTKLTSLIGQQNLGKSKTTLATSMERLASGLRINSAKDDAAGQAIGNRLQAQRTGLGQAARNVNDGISLSQTAQGVLEEVNDRLHRIRELTVQGLNEIYNGEEGDRIQAEINMNLKEIERLNTMAEYNGIPLINGSAGTKSLQVGANDKEVLNVDLNPPGFSVEELGLKDLTFQGRPDEITHVDQLIGRAHTIPIDDAATELEYIPPGSAPHLVKFDGRNVVQLESDGNRLKNQHVVASHDTDTLMNSVDIYVSDAELTYASGVSTYYLNDFKDSEGNILTLDQANLVSADGKYWIEYVDGGDKFYYQAEVTTTKDPVSGNKVDVQALDDTRVSRDALPPYIYDMPYSPGVSKSDAAFSLELDGNEESSNPNITLVSLGSKYYVEEKLSSGEYSYYNASVVSKTDGSVSSISVESSRETMPAVVDQPYVSGSSRVHLIPENQNVVVEYVDLSGQVYSDVMVSDGENGYTFNVGAFENAPGAVKTANIVKNKNGDDWLQTVNGAGEVILYYPMSESVSTNVENNVTTLRVYEAEAAERIRNPAEPLAALDNAIARVDGKLGQFGALDNRLGSVIESNELTSINLASAQSRIMDADYAVEVADMTRAQILQEAGTSVLAQANQIPQNILMLLE